MFKSQSENQLEQKHIHHHHEFPSNENKIYQTNNMIPTTRINYHDQGVIVNENPVLTTQESFRTNSSAYQQNNHQQIQYIQTLPQNQQNIQYVQTEYVDRNVNYVPQQNIISHQNIVPQQNTVSHQHIVPQQNIAHSNQNFIIQNVASSQVIAQPTNISVTPHQQIIPQNNISYHQIQNKNVIQSQIIGNDCMESIIVNRPNKVRYSLSPPIRQEVMYSRAEARRSLSPMRVISREFIQQGPVSKSDETLNLKKELDLYKAKCNHLENHLHGSKSTNIESTIVNVEIQNKLSIYMKEVQELRKKNLQLELSCEAIDNERERNERSKKNANQEKNYLVSEISKLRELLLLRFKHLINLQIIKQQQIKLY